MGNTVSLRDAFMMVAGYLIIEMRHGRIQNIEYAEDYETAVNEAHDRSALTDSIYSVYDIEENVTLYVYISGEIDYDFLGGD